MYKGIPIKSRDIDEKVLEKLERPRRQTIMTTLDDTENIVHSSLQKDEELQAKVAKATKDALHVDLS